MKAGRAPGTVLAVVCVLCALMTVRFDEYLGPSEFAGGSLTGRLLTALTMARYLFVLAAALPFLSGRAAAVFALPGIVLSLPLYLYLLAPGPFRTIAGGNYSVPLAASVRWDGWAVAATALLVLAAWMSLRTLRKA